MTGQSTNVDLAIVMAQMEAPPWYVPDEAVPTRLERACELVEADQVTDLEPGTWRVQGRTGVYHVTEKSCTCDHSAKGHGFCYHRVAAELYARLQPRVQAPLRLVRKAVIQARERAGPPRTPAGGTQSPLRSIRAIIADLSVPLPAECIATMSRPGEQDIQYLHWWDVRFLLDTYAPGWRGTIIEKKEWSREEMVSQWVEEGGRRRRILNTVPVHVCTVNYRLTIPCAEGEISREAIGRETAESVPYGDWSSNASAMAFTRAAAMFGVGVWLREKAEQPTSTRLRTHLTKRAWKDLAALCDQRGLRRDQVAEQLLVFAGIREKAEASLEDLQRFLEQLRRAYPQEIWEVEDDDA